MIQMMQRLKLSIARRPALEHQSRSAAALRLLGVLVAAACLTALTACQAGQVEDPIGVMTAADVTSAKRLKAARQAEKSHADDPRRIDALRQYVFNAGHALSLQQYAADELLDYDEPRFRQLFAEKLSAINRWELRLNLLNRAVKNKWTEYTAGAVRTYAEPVRGYTDATRPERGIIAKLNPGQTVEDVIFHQFADTQGLDRHSDRVAAWELLCRLEPTDELVRKLQSVPTAGTALIGDLQAAARDLRTVPVNREGVLWLSWLRGDAQRSYFAELRTAAANLTTEQAAGLELRHLPVLLAMDAAYRDQSREQLLAALEARTAGRDLNLRSPTWDGQPADHPQRLYDARDQLTWADLATVLTLDAMLHRPGAAATLFAQADADRIDPTTEYGGVLDRTGFARLYKPNVRQHDRKFIPSRQMILDCYGGVAHYHFHAQSTQNGNYAGPGRGDLEFADRLQFNCLVITPIDSKRLGIDFYRHGSLVIDLGELHRP